MPSTLGIGRRNLRHLNLNLCFSNLTPESPPPPPNPNPMRRSRDYDIHHNRPSSPTTSSSIMIKNFNSLYEPQQQPEPADFATAFASQRFFFSSPGPSNSLIEHSNTHTDHSDHNIKNNCKKKILFNFKGSVAVTTYSPDPYLDFRRSMQEMVEGRPELRDVNSNWDILHELLLCYLALNPKSTHKFILAAFADLLVTIMSFSDDDDDAGAAATARVC